MGSTYYVDPAAGGSNNGTSWTHAWTSVQSAFDTAVAGDVCYCRGTQTVSATIDVDTNSGTNAAGFIKFIGCNASGTVDGTRFTIQGDGANAVHLMTKTGAISMIWIENFRFTAAYTAKSGFNGQGDTTQSGAWLWINCSFDTNAADGMTGMRYCNVSWYFRCCFHSNGGYGYNGTVYGGKFYFCSFHDNTSTGHYGGGSSQLLFGCILHGNGDDGVSPIATYSSDTVHCVIDGNTDDGYIVAAGTGTVFQLIFGTRITNHSGSGDIGLNCNSEPVITAYCYFEDNDGDNIQNATLHQFIPAINLATTSNLEDLANTTEGYVSTTGGSEDFSTNYVDSGDPDLRRTAITIPWT